MSKQNDPTLPSWAQVSYYDNKEDIELSFEEEASYIQSRAYLLLARDLDQIVDEAMIEALHSVYEEMISFLSIRASKDDTLKSENPYCISPPSQYPNKLLPLALLNGPSHVLDAQEYLMCLRRMIQKHNHQVAICHIDISQATTIHTCTAWMSQILMHCYIQDDYDISGVESAPTRKNQAYLISRKIIDWARATDKFKSIVVMIRGRAAIMPSSLQDFLHLLAELREAHRLPISLVWIGDNIPYDSTSQGVEGIRCQSFLLPEVNTIMKPLWKELLMNPHNFSIDVLQKLHTLHKDHHGSFVQTLRLVKQILAVSANSENYSTILRPSKRSQEYRKRLKWFYTHPTARRIYMDFDSKKDLFDQFQKVHDTTLTQKLGIQIIFELCDNDDVEFLLDIVISLSRQSSRQIMAKKIVQHIKSTSPQHKLSFRLDSTRKIILRCDDENNLSRLGKDLRVCSNGSTLKSTLKSLHELIILFYFRLQMNHKPIQIEDEIWILFEELLFKLLEDMALSRKTISDGSHSPLDIILPEHRSRIIQALQDIDNGDISLSIQNISAILFRLLRNSVSISQNDWYNLFYNSKFHWKDDYLTDEDACFLFSLGVYQLQHVGLIRTKLRRGMVIYERVALVWSPYSKEK